MNFILLFILLICLYQIKLTKNSDYMEKDKTTSIKGIFVLLIFLSHIAQYAAFDGNIDSVYIIIRKHLDQLIVTMFLFYSGYGIMESIKRKGIDYIKGLPKKRILKVLFEFDIAVVIFFILGIILGEKFGKLQILLSLVGWDSLGNSNWFIFAIIITYMFTYLSFMIFKDKHIGGAVLVTIFSVLYIYIMKHFKQMYWFNTILCYPLGIWFSLYRKQIDDIFKKYKITYWLSLIALIVVYNRLFYYRYMIRVYVVYAMIFSAIVILFTMKITINNKILNWLGKYTFEIYMLQRIPMIILKQLGLNQSKYIFFLLTFILTLLIAILFKKFIILIEENIPILRNKVKEKIN